MKRKKMLLTIILVLVLVVAGLMAWKFLGPRSGAENQEPQVIENQGDIEIIIPDDQESDGF